MATGPVIGLCAHVDAGNTPLSASMLFLSGTLRRQGRVDHGDAFLDTNPMEKDRGITIFSKEARLSWNRTDLTLMDTPGHTDFSGETERVLSVLDGCVLLVSALDGVQSHTRTLWRLLSLYGIPTVLFVTKMDYARYTEEELLKNLSEALSDNCISFGGDAALRDEQIAMTTDAALDHFMEQGRIPDDMIRKLIRTRQIFPVFFGSGLKLSGVSEFLQGLVQYIPERRYPAEFGARIFKISHDDSGSRLLHLKITGGSFRVRDSLPGIPKEEKISQIRVYTGERYLPVDSAEAGDICVVTGIRSGYAGMGLGIEAGSAEPVLGCRIS